MPEYRVGDQIVRRKNLYLPCIINARINDLPDEEQAQILKATKWADRITNAEWAALLGEDGCSPSAKSRLKSKSAEWLVALARIAFLNPELFAEIAGKASETYSEQIEHDSFLLQTVRNIAEARIALEEGETVESSVARVSALPDEDAA